MSESKTYSGSCHCGSVRYTAELDLGKPVMSCNCSICGRSGVLMAFIPASKFTLVAGEDSLTNYQFNKHVINHLFCKKCGIKSFSRGRTPDGTEMVAVNARSLEGVEVSALQVNQFDGRSV